MIYTLQDFDCTPKAILWLLGEFLPYKEKRSLAGFPVGGFWFLSPRIWFTLSLFLSPFYLLSLSPFPFSSPGFAPNLFFLLTTQPKQVKRFCQKCHWNTCKINIFHLKNQLCAASLSDGPNKARSSLSWQFMMQACGNPRILKLSNCHHYYKLAPKKGCSFPSVHRRILLVHSQHFSSAALREMSENLWTYESCGFKFRRFPQDEWTYEKPGSYTLSSLHTWRCDLRHNARAEWSLQIRCNDYPKLYA